MRNKLNAHLSHQYVISIAHVIKNLRKYHFYRLHYFNILIFQSPVIGMFLNLIARYAQS